MKIDVFGREDKVDFDAGDLDRLIRPHGAINYDHLSRLAGANSDVALYKPANREPVVLRREHANKAKYLPNGLSNILDLICWYEPELLRLAEFGLRALPHQTYVVSEDPAIDGPTIYTAAPFVKDPKLLDGHGPGDGKLSLADCGSSMLVLLYRLRTYYSAAAHAQREVIGDINHEQQWHGIDTGDHLLTPELIDMDHYRHEVGTAAVLSYVTDNRIERLQIRMEAAASKRFTNKAQA